MDHTITRIAENLVARITGPMKFRLLMQPSMAIFLAIRSGLKDAREGKAAYFWALFTEPAERRAMLKDGWKSMGRLFILAVLLDVVYQIIEFRWVYPGESLLVAFILAVVPYVLLRGPVNRIARRTSRGGRSHFKN
jgi:hypothetical protein